MLLQVNTPSHAGYRTPALLVFLGLKPPVASAILSQQARHPAGHPCIGQGKGRGCAWSEAGCTMFSSSRLHVHGLGAMCPSTLGAPLGISLSCHPARACLLSVGCPSEGGAMGCICQGRGLHLSRQGLPVIAVVLCSWRSTRPHKGSVS